MSTVAGELLEPIVADLQEFERRLVDSIAADLGPMASAMEHIVKAGGKRLRPALVILSGRLGSADRALQAAVGSEGSVRIAPLVGGQDEALSLLTQRTLPESWGQDLHAVCEDYRQSPLKS